MTHHTAIYSFILDFRSISVRFSLRLFCLYFSFSFSFFLSIKESNSLFFFSLLILFLLDQRWMNEAVTWNWLKIRSLLNKISSLVNLINPFMFLRFFILIILLLLFGFFILKDVMCCLVNSHSMYNLWNTDTDTRHDTDTNTETLIILFKNENNWM